jgi:hypothetical protein
MEISLSFSERTGTKTFFCPKEGCDRSYSKYAWWRRHVTECCYPCRCGKLFESKLVLLLHAAEEHSDIVDSASPYDQDSLDTAEDADTPSVGSASPDSGRAREPAAIPYKYAHAHAPSHHMPLGSQVVSRAVWYSMQQ